MKQLKQQVILPTYRLARDESDRVLILDTLIGGIKYGEANQVISTVWNEVYHAVHQNGDIPVNL